eukprot:CAMPEP_0194260468 /NCGR_PEP_ID=MMETSP0158-20130606/45528_1 /TAXON_ID=33649 /ORGANISM="Thalassionema nitzschioides, Strain L26-B" /LENGTH=317 /DNA_ID=CAMNT_0039000561 /DNA_START=105 /DNA_END=1060 /DNA_ORIENTATION=-
MDDSPTKDTDEFFDLDSHPEFGVVSNSSSMDEDDAGHRSVSPLNPAESFFLSPELRTNQISAFALATELRHKTGSRYRGSRSGQSTVATDDFHSAVGSETDHFRYNLITNRSADTFFGKDIIIEQDESMTSDEPINAAHQYKTQIATDKNCIQIEVAPKDGKFLISQVIHIKSSSSGKDIIIEQDESMTSDEPINAAQTVYGKTKEIWAWGKDLPVIGFFEGVAESVAGKVVEIAGTTLEDVDQTIISPKLAGLDTSFLNPIVEKIIEALMAAGANANQLITYVGKPLGIIEAEEKKKPVKTIAPEVTSTKRNAGVF